MFSKLNFQNVKLDNKNNSNNNNNNYSTLFLTKKNLRLFLHFDVCCLHNRFMSSDDYSFGKRLFVIFRIETEKKHGFMNMHNANQQQQNG